MEILEIDCTSYATNVAYVAAERLYELLITPAEASEDFTPWSFLLAEHPHHQADPQLLERVVANMGAYVCSKGCESGERLYLYLTRYGVISPFFSVPWNNQQDEVRLALETFVSVCSKTHTKLRCLQLEAENKARRPEPTPAPKIEDTIFEPIGSMAELEPHAEQSMKAWDDSARRAAEASGEGEPHAALSLGETVQSGSGEGQDNSGDLPPSPQTPAQRKASRKGKKSSK